MEDLVQLAGVVVAVLALALGFRWLRSLSGATVIVVFGEGRVRVKRGQVPGLLLGELGDIARGTSRPEGRLEWSGQGTELVVSTRGLDDGSAQRARNTVMFHLGRR